MNRYNNLRILLLLILINSLFSACKKDSDVSPNIVGKWQQQAYQYRIVYEVSGSRYDKTGTRTKQGNSIIEFKADGTVGGFSRPQTYTLSGDQVTLRYGTITETGKVIIAGDQLTLTGIDNLIAGLSEADKLKQAKGWSYEVNGSGGGNGVYTDINKATKAYEVYSAAIYQRVP